MIGYQEGSSVVGGDIPMTKLVAMIVALGVACAFTAPTFAADVTTAKTHHACTKAGGIWDTKTKTCKAKTM
jgi:hypothetical protein